MHVTSPWVMSEVWSIEKYARFKTSSDKTGKGQWQQYDDTHGKIVLTLTDSCYLVLCQGTTVLESHSLITARAWMRGMTKRDSMLLMYKAKEETRRFRMKFHGTDDRSGEEQCSSCAARLSKYFPVKFSVPPVTGTTGGKPSDTTVELQPDGEEELIVDGEVTLGKMAKIVSGELKARLPLAYKECEFPAEELDTVLRLCLSDPTFPAFVEQVDSQLQNIMKEDS